MLDGLMKFSNALCNAAPKLYDQYRKGKHEDKIIELLECFYILGDLIKTADELLILSRGKEEVVFSDLSEEQLNEHYELVQGKLTIQLQRLQRLGDIFMSNPTLDLLDVDIKDELMSAIGGKEDGLFQLGAGLFFNQMLGGSKIEGESKAEWSRRVVKGKYEFAGSINDLNRFSIDEQRLIVSELKQLRKRYRDLLDDITEAEHKTLLASQAIELAQKYSVRI